MPSRAASMAQGEGNVDETEAQILSTSAPLRPPLRKVISHSDMTRFLRRERSSEERDSPSPTAPVVQPSSPHKLRKKSSRISLAQAPRLEPAFRPNFDPSRRRSVFQRSPSPPSPRNAGKTRGPSLGMSLRSKSSENVLNTNRPSNGHSTGFGSLTASSESVIRTLRAYRKKLASSAPSDSIAPDVLRELEKELKMTARAVGEKSQSKNLDEAIMARLLDQASDKIVGLLDEKIKARVENEVRRNGDVSPTAHAGLEHIQESVERSDTVPGAVESRQPDS